MKYALRHQRTIARRARVEGFGYWSGADGYVEFQPAASDSGITFVRDDLPGALRVAANIVGRIETPRRTTLADGPAIVEMVEHVVAALAGLRIDNCDVHVSAREIPGCDGSSREFVEALQSAGAVKQNALRRLLVVTDTTRVGDEHAWVEARPSESPGLTVRYRLDYGSGSPIARQTIQLGVTPESFARELAPARTFILQEEAEWLRRRGLGGRATFADLLVFGKEGPIDNETRFDDECARHKALDLVGDLALAGCDIDGKIIAHRSGHRLNSELVRALLHEGQVIQPLRKSA